LGKTFDVIRSIRFATAAGVMMPIGATQLTMKLAPQ
jgi:hypothetical protein